MSEVENIRDPKAGSIEAAVSQLLKEPEAEAPVTPEEQEPVEAVEQEVTESEAVEEEQVTEGEDPEEYEVEEEGEEEGEEETETLDYYTIKIDGEELEVTLDELRSGYQRQSDYTKKTQAVAEERKAYEAKQSELAELSNSFIQQATLANELLNRDLKKYEALDWENLKVNDPVGYVQKQIEVQEIRTEQAKLRAEAQKVYEHNQKVIQQEQAQYLEAQRKETLKLFPDWKDETKAAEAQGKLLEYGRSIGYDDHQLSAITNANDLLVLDKARKYDELQASKESIAKKKTAPSVRKVTRGKAKAPQKTTRRKKVQARQDQLRKTGSLRDAAALMHEMQQGNAIKK